MDSDIESLCFVDFTDFSGPYRRRSPGAAVQAFYPDTRSSPYLLLSKVCLPLQWSAILGIEKNSHSRAAEMVLEVFPFMGWATSFFNSHERSAIGVLLSYCALCTLILVHVASLYRGRKRSNIIICLLVSILLGGMNVERCHLSPQETMVVFAPLTASVGVSLGLFWNMLA